MPFQERPTLSSPARIHPLTAFVPPASVPPTPSRNPARSAHTSRRAARGQQDGETFWQRVDREMWSFFQGRKEDMWQPDQRPENQRGRFDRTQSSLSWSRAYAKTVLQKSAEWNPATPRYDAVPGERGGVATQVATKVAVERKEEPKSNVVLTEANSKSSDAWVEQVQKVADFADVPEEQDERSVTGRQLAEYCYAKYGHYYDMTILQAKPFGNDEDRRQVALNVYGAYLGDNTIFKYTEEQYLARLDRIAGMLNSWDQAWFVRDFFRAPVVPRRGLPSTPKPDTAVTLRLNTSPTWKYVNKDIIEPWFTF
eukprot:CAMPEP_0198333966 /NCGR_PEP_ID=MMETSP1450-20131203/19301_1 /TAXON_ID=753684 ORGANISM="Madagascaria erythrocladiodes, Strain CCMP3234" /NCGR_SAMPLE_ID=MMETSP1450 /ASSEMBLY_ACC=CAM_ASM_001115 /LENGTH=310 /DNA_ID=CAMNT_0044038517 /DNA_START=38 /DNA_END=970 /DNA_ORIENTATION=-